METSRDERISCSTDVFDETGNKSVGKSESVASCSSIQDPSGSVRNPNSTFYMPNVDASNQNRVASGSKQTGNTSSLSISQQSVRYKNKTKTSLPPAKVQKSNPPTTSTTTGSTKLNSLPGQVDDRDHNNRNKKHVPINPLKVKGQDHKVLTNSQRTKALETISTQRKNIGINVRQPTRTALQTKKKTNIHQGQIQDSDAATDQKRNKFNKSPVINIQNSKQNLQSQVKPKCSHKGDLSPFNKENSLKCDKISPKYGSQSQKKGKLTASSSEKAPRTNLPNFKASKTFPESSISVNSKTLGKCVKESANKLPHGRKNTQNANKKNLTVPNKYQETPSLASSENSDAATELSTEEQTALHMNHISPQPVKFPSNEEKIIGDQGNDLEFLDLKETGNEKFSVDEVQNRSMISEKGNEDSLNPENLEISTILFDTKTLLEPGDMKNFSYCPNRQNAKEAFLRAKKTSIITNLHIKEIVMETFLGAMKTSLKNEEEVMEILLKAEQASSENYQIVQEVFSFCSKIKNRTIEERLMTKRKVEKLQSLIGNEDKKSFQAKEHGEIVNVPKQHTLSQGDRGESKGLKKHLEGWKEDEESKKSLESETSKLEVEIFRQVEIESVDMSYLPKDEVVELPFLKNVKKAVEVFLQKEDDAVNTSLQNVEKVLETSQNEETEDIEAVLHENETVKTSLEDNTDIQLPLQIEGESVDMSYLPDDDSAQNVKETVEVLIQKEDADVNASLPNGTKVLVTTQNEEVVELSSQNEKETVQIGLQRENETVDMSPLYEEKEDIEITLQDKKAVQNSLQSEESVEISLHEKVDKGISLHEDKETIEITSPYKKTVKISYLHEKEATGMSLLHDKEVEKPLYEKAVQTSLHDKESIGMKSLRKKFDEMSFHDMKTENSYLCKKDVNDNFSPTLEGKIIVSENKANVTSNKSKNIDNTEDIFESPYDETARRVMFSSASLFFKDLENPEKCEMPNFQNTNENEEVQNKFSGKESHVLKENTGGGQNDRTVGLSDASCENKTGGSEKCNEVIREEADFCIPSEEET